MRDENSSPKRPHLAIITLDFKPQTGGVQEYLFQIAQLLAASRQVTVLTPAPGTLPTETPFRRILLPDGKAPTFWHALRQLNPDKLLVGHAHPQLLAAAWFWSRFGRHNYAVLAHGSDFLAAQRHWHRPIFNYWLSRARPLTTNSRTTQANLTQCGLPSSHIIYPGTNPDQFRPDRRTAVTQTPVLLTVGRLVARKGVDTMLQALPAVLDQTAVTYHIAGDGPDRPRLEKLAHDLGVVPAIRFLGRVNDEALPQTYASADLFVMPNRDIPDQGSQEGFGIVFLEASASGLPVIAGRSGGAVEAVRDGETGLLVPPDDPQALATAVLALLQDPARRQQMGQAGRRWVETTMNWDRAANQFAAILDDLAE